MGGAEKGSASREPARGRPAASELPGLKGRFAFQLATTSCILPAPIIPNLHFLGPHLDEVELVLFKSGAESNLASSLQRMQTLTKRKETP